MSRLFALTLLSLSAALPALAQDVPPAAPGKPKAMAIFFSPSGETFRAPLKDPYPVVLWFDAADTDKDGALSLEEYMADADRFFAVVDRDGKGVITSPDNSNYENTLSPDILGFSPLVTQPKVRERAEDQAMSPTGPQRYVKRIVGAAQFSLINEPQPIRGADANLDFRVTRDEWTQTSMQRFTLLDADKDNRLTLAELPQTPLQIGLADLMAERAKKADKKKGGLFGGGNR